MKKNTQEGTTKVKELTAEEAKALVNRLGPSLGYDLTYSPVFPKDRKDVCVVRRMAENGTTYGFDTIYLIWKNLYGSLEYDKVMDSKETKDYIFPDAIEVTTDGHVLIKLRSGGSYSGKPWEKTVKIWKPQLNIE